MVSNNIAAYVASSYTIYLPNTSNHTYHQAAERRQREEGWNDLGLDQLDSRGNWSAASSNNNNQGTPAGPNNAPQQDQQQQQQQQPGQG